VQDYRTWLVASDKMSDMDQQLTTHTRLPDMSDNLLFRHVTDI
jgi:hypothetical protein